MSSAPSFSIITPAFNAARFLPRCHWSLTRQTIPDWEWIVVDDGSTDGTRDVIAAMNDERIRYHRLPQNQGRGPARNFALAQARGAWSAMLDADDFSLPPRLARAAEARAAGDEFFCSAMALIDDAYSVRGVRGAAPEAEPRLFPHATLAGDTALLRGIGYPALRRAQDQTMVLTLANTRRGRFSREPLYVYHENAAALGPREAFASQRAMLAQTRALARQGVLRRTAGLRRLQQARVARMAALLPFFLWPRAYRQTLRTRDNFSSGADPLDAAGRAFIAEGARLFPMNAAAPAAHGP